MVDREWIPEFDPLWSGQNDERVLPLMVGLLYAPSLATLLSSDTYGGPTYWPL